MRLPIFPDHLRKDGSPQALHFSHEQLLLRRSPDRGTALRGDGGGRGVKQGQRPIHIQRWAPADYHADEHVKFLKSRHRYRTLTFYRHFIDHSWSAGGSLPCDVSLLSAIVEMPPRHVRAALDYCVGRLIFKDGDRYFQARVMRDVSDELNFRAEQARVGRKGGLTAGKGRPLSMDRDSPNQPLSADRGSLGPPSPLPAPTPTPAPITDSGPASPAGDDGAHPRVEATPAEARSVALARLGPPPGSKPWSTEACEIWIERFGGTAPGGQIGKALKPLMDRHGWPEVRLAWQSYLAQTEADYASPSRFASTYGRWSGTSPPPARAAPSTDRARARQASAEALIRGGLTGDLRPGVDRGDGSTRGVLHERGPDAGDGDAPRALLPRGPRGPDG